MILVTNNEKYHYKYDSYNEIKEIVRQKQKILINYFILMKIIFE